MARRTPRWLSETEQQTWRRYQQMRMLLTARLESDLVRETGLSSADYEVLVHLSEASDGRLRAYELSAAILWEKSRLSHHLSRMERRGLIRRDECPTDARGAFIVLTDEGWAAITEAAPKHVESVRRHLIDVLSADQIVALDDIAQTVLRELGAAAAPTGARQDQRNS